MVVKKELDQLRQSIENHKADILNQRDGARQIREKAKQEPGSLCLHIDAKTDYYYPKLMQETRNLPKKKFSVSAMGSQSYSFWILVEENHEELTRVS